MEEQKEETLLLYFNVLQIFPRALNWLCLPGEHP